MTEIRNSDLRWFLSLALLVTSLTIDVSSEHLFLERHRTLIVTFARFWLTNVFPVTVRTANTGTRFWLQFTCGDRGCYRELASDDSC